MTVHKRFALIVVLAALLTASCGTSGAPRNKPTIDKSPKLQADRKALMDKLVTEGYFTEIVRNGAAMPRVWVTPKFSAGDFKDKQNVLSAVYAYYFDGSGPSDSVAVVDAKSGQEIGRFDKAGLHLN